MRDELVADIGDFGKYAMLRALFGRPEENEIPDHGLNLGIVWYYNYDIGQHGNLIGYLCPPAPLAQFDPFLHARLHALVKEGRRTVHDVREEEILQVEHDSYFQCVVADPRGQWIQMACAGTANSDVIFLDPDTGVVNGGHADIQHVTIEQLNDFYIHGGGKSLIIFQDLRYAPGGVTNRIDHLARLLRSQLDPGPQIWALRWRRGPRRVYFVVVHPNHAGVFNPQVQGFVNNQNWFCRQPRFRHPHFQNVPLNQQGQ